MLKPEPMVFGRKGVLPETVFDESVGDRKFEHHPQCGPWLLIRNLINNKVNV